MVVLGVSIGVVIGPLITQPLLDTYGLRGCMLLFSAINLYGFIYTSLYRLPIKRNEDLNIKPSCSTSITIFIPFMVYLVGLIMTVMGEFFNYIYTPLRAESMHIHANKRAWLMSKIGIFSAVARPVAGWIGISSCMNNKQCIVFGLYAFLYWFLGLLTIMFLLLHIV